MNLAVAQADCQTAKINSLPSFPAILSIPILINIQCTCRSCGLDVHVGTSILSPTKFGSKFWVQCFCGDHSHCTVIYLVPSLYQTRASANLLILKKQRENDYALRTLKGMYISVVLSDILVHLCWSLLQLWQCFWRCWRDRSAELAKRWFASGCTILMDAMFLHSEYLCYDDACHLHKYSLNPCRQHRTPTTKILSNLTMAVDKMHMAGSLPQSCSVLWGSCNYLLPLTSKYTNTTT